MSILQMRAKLALAVSVLLVSGCEYEMSFYRELYRENCPEARTVAFESLSVSSTCKGEPLLHALAGVQHGRVLQDLPRLIDYMVTKLNFDPNQASGREGKTALMVAIQKNNPAMARELVLRTGPEITDAKGWNYLHYLAASGWSDYTGVLVSSQTLGESAGANGQAGLSPMAVAVQSNNTSFIWRVLQLTGRVDLVHGFSPNFLFDRQAENGLAVLDALDPQLLAPYRGPLSARGRDGRPQQRRVSQYTLLHFAAEQAFPELTQYLLQRLEPDLMSSEGSALKLALSGAGQWTTQAELSRWRRTVTALLGNEKALAVPDAYQGLMFAGQIDWIKAARNEDLPIHSYQNLLLANSGSNSQLQALLLNCPTHCDHAQLREALGAGILSAANAAGQNAAHFFYSNVPVSAYDKIAGGWLTDGFSWFSKSAARAGLLDQADILDNLPVHLWLGSEARAKARGDRAEPARLRQLLQLTRKAAAFNGNRDTVLSLAVSTGNAELVREVLRSVPELKKAIDVPNKLGHSALSLARKSEDKEIYEMLAASR